MYKWDQLKTVGEELVLCDVCGYKLRTWETYHEEGYNDYPTSPDMNNTITCMSCWDLHKEYEDKLNDVTDIWSIYQESFDEYAKHIAQGGPCSEKTLKAAMRFINSKHYIRSTQPVSVDYDRCGMCNETISGDVAYVTCKDTWRYLCYTCNQLYKTVEAAEAEGPLDTTSFQNVWKFIKTHPNNPLVKEYKGCVEPVDPDGRAAFRGSYHKIADGTDRCTMCLALIREGEVFTHTDYAKAAPVQLCGVCEHVSKYYIDDDHPVDNKQAEEWFWYVIDNRDEFDQETVDAAHMYEDRAAVRYSSDMV